MKRNDGAESVYKMTGEIKTEYNKAFHELNEYLWEHYSNTSIPSRSPQEVLYYVLSKYPVRRLNEDNIHLKMAALNVITNYYPQEIEKDADPFDIRDELYDIAVNKLLLDIRIYTILNEGNGRLLYNAVERQNKNMDDICFSIELVTGWGSVSGSGTLGNEILVYKGLDEDKKQNKDYKLWYLRSMFELGMIK